MSVSCCFNLACENERLTRKICRLKEKLQDTKERLHELQSSSGHLRCTSSSCNEFESNDESKTGSKDTYSSIVHQSEESRLKELEENFEASKARLLAMHNKTTRLYHSELQQKQDLKEQVQELRTQNDLLQIKGNEDKQKILTLERRIAELETMNMENTASTSRKIKELTTKSDKLYTENVLLRRELSAFDPEFFEELEDLKYSLKTSKQLNLQYEKSLERICRHYKVPFVKPSFEMES